MNLIQRSKRIWQLSKKDPDLVDALIEQEIQDIPDVPSDEKAVFLGEGTHEEWLKQEREDNGLTNIFDIDHE